MVIVPWQPPRAVAGQVRWTRTSPRAVMLTDFADMRTGVAGGEPDAGKALGGGDGVDGSAEATVTARIAWALSPPLRLIVWPVKTCVVEGPAESGSVNVAGEVPGAA